MKCGLNNFWWQYPNRLVCEGSAREPENTDKRNGYGFWKVCDGDILLELGTEEHDLNYPEIRVSFWCNKCGNGHYPEKNLPYDRDSLESWINEILQKDN